MCVLVVDTAIAVLLSCRVMLQRYICWMHTTPTILLLVKMISTSISRKQVRQAHAQLLPAWQTAAQSTLGLGLWHQQAVGG